MWGFPGAKVAVDAYVSLDGWDVVVWQRRSSPENLPVLDLVIWLREHGVPFVVAADSVASEGTRRVAAAFSPFGALLEEVAAHVTEVVAAIARAEVGPGEWKAVRVVPGGCVDAMEFASQAVVLVGVR